MKWTFKIPAYKTKRFSRSLVVRFERPPSLVRRLIPVGGAVAGIFLLLAAWFVYAAWFSVARAGRPTAIQVEEGISARGVYAQLAEHRLVSRLGYTLYAMIDVNARHPKAGEYAFRRGTSYRDIATALAEGPARPEATVRLIEGETIAQQADRLFQAHGVATSTFFAVVGESRNAAPFDERLIKDYPFLADIPAGASLEGYLFPDTYRVWEDLLPAGLVYKQLDEFNTRVIEPYTEAQSKSGMTWHQILTLASIVEDEMHGTENRRIVAGIFLNRLNSGMMLQSDATINYFTGAGRARSTYTDLAVDSPYNTYKYGGLPPGPIGNPSLSSIQAVLNPAQTNYYFFLTDAQGNVYYARNGAEHQANRARAYGE
ncbi:MAG: endolytic transglycosylase MltG [Candidatus Parcubacteria bacterium]|jgi:UPF0755 protein